MAPRGSVLFAVLLREGFLTDLTVDLQGPGPQAALVWQRALP